MDFNQLKKNLTSTPAFVLDETALVNNLKQLAELKKQSGCQVLYSIKALPLEYVLKLAGHYLDGLSVSSLFEARLAKEILADAGTIHITTPGLRIDEFEEISRLCSHISFNSTSQFQRLYSQARRQSSLGLRVNPKLSFVSDLRFDPCRPHSKLGVDIDCLTSIPEQIEGLHFHTIFSNTNYNALEKTVNLVEQKLASSMKQLKWLNLGGGYLYQQIANHQPFIDLVRRLKAVYDIEVFVEPGKAVVGNAGYLVSTVIDRFASDGKSITVLDTSVNHNPEVFEYQISPKLLEDDIQGAYPSLLVGSCCLAGDIFGEYRFKRLPKVGDRLIFSNVGAYSLIKANRFNGYNFPDVYSVDKDNNIMLIKQSTYQDYRQQW